MNDSLIVGPLEGLKVLEIGDLAEITGKLLADAGARVIRIEPLEGAKSRHQGPYVDDVFDVNHSLRFAASNTSKLSITLSLNDLRSEELLVKLFQDVDVILDGSSIGTLNNISMSAERALKLKPEIIWCSITPFGLTGPWKDWHSSDLVQLALGGPMMSTGYDDHDLPPIRSDGEHSLAIAGEYAVTALLSALWLRDMNDGRAGQIIDVSVHEAVSATTEGAFANWEYMQKIVLRQTGRHAAPVRMSPWQYPCKDGEYVLMMGGGIPREKKIFDVLLEWMDEYKAAGDLHDPSYVEVLYTDPTMNVEIRNHVSETIGRFIQLLPAEDVYRRAQDLHLPWGLVRSPEENLDDPHWKEREFWWEGEVSGYQSTVLYPGAPYKFEKSPVYLRRRPPLLGEHNYQIYAEELGYSEAELIAFANSGIV